MERFDMSLRLRQLHLRVQTGEGLFGTRIQFNDGLVLLRADNTMGKSTCVQAIIYALGLEKMLGPSSTIPLPHVMTAYLNDGEKEIRVLESEVLLEIENHKGESLTIQRSVIGERDPRLVSTWEGARLTNPNESLPKRDFYARDPGSAQNESGFTRKLAEFVGWQLPMVRRFNGTECPLYLEAVCPLFVVEQKHGWAGIQSNLPTYFGIRDMAKRCIEFVLNLDAARLADERQRLEQEETILKNRWKNLTNAAGTYLRLVNARLLGLPEQPSAQWPLSIIPTIEVFQDSEWIEVERALDLIKDKYFQLEQTPIVTAGEASESARSQLETAQRTLADRELIAGELLEELQQEQIQQASTNSRLSALGEDLRRNKDALKLRSFGSNAGWHVIEHVCPTCQQQLADTLLLQGSLENPMSVEENITFVENQIKTFKQLRENAASLIARKESELSTYRMEIENVRIQIRSLRQTLLAPTSSPSIEAVRLRIDIESRVRTLERVISDFTESLESFAEVAVAWRGVLDRKRNLPSNGLSAGDRNKLRRLETLLRDQLQEFGFNSLDQDTLEISTESYRPTREGFDLGFDLSASDNIRTIWAFLQGLLELSAVQPMNHFGMLLFDEPRQQETAEMSFEKLLVRAATAKKRGQQIVFATSEPLANIQRMINGLDVQIINYTGRVISRI
ncbi:MAG: hypothetical protein IPP94_07735 [Ignavibacteria bacterium]|nr:hypothetical protein [Ignavibacteria bacterium]